jgi:hypothetical protein
VSEQIVDRAELRRMAPDEVARALADGRFDELFAGGAASPLSGTRERLSRMSAGEVVAALNAGELDDFLAGRVE